MPPTARDPTTSRLPEKESWYVEVVEQARAGDKLAFDTWLYRIATNLAIDYLRRRKFHWSSWETIENEDVPASMRIAGPEELVAEKEHVRQALAKVSLKYRTCLLLQLVADFSQRQIAAALKISEKSVSVYVSRGCEQFRVAYQQLSHTNEQIMTDRGKSSDNIEHYPLFRSGK